MPKTDTTIIRQYLLTQSMIINDGQTFTTYGIGVIEGDFIADIVHDVSPDQSFVRRLVELCNAGQLSPCHLRDIIEDALN